MDHLTGWYMAQINGRNFLTFQAASDAEADSKIASLRDSSSDHTATLGWVRLEDDLKAFAQQSGLTEPD